MKKTDKIKVACVVIRKILGVERCYGCGKLIWWWQDAVNTEAVGYIHRHCVIAANMKLIAENMTESIYKQFAVALGVKGEKE